LFPKEISPNIPVRQNRQNVKIKYQKAKTQIKVQKFNRRNKRALNSKNHFSAFAV
jgi:hypothetical protein